MKRKNFKLIEALWENKISQCEFARKAGLSSEARLSRIINRLVEPTNNEIRDICRTLDKSPTSLGLKLTKESGDLK